MANKQIVTTSKLDALADSIASKTGAAAPLTIDQMKSAVDNFSFTTQSKIVTPTQSTQSIIPDNGFDGLSNVTVNPIPSAYLIPSGTMSITQNGIGIDVGSYAAVDVNVEGGSGDYFADDIAMHTFKSEIYGSSATRIYANAFASCSNLISVDFPNVSYIGSSAFYNCSNLTSVSFLSAE